MSASEIVEYVRDRLVDQLDQLEFIQARAVIALLKNRPDDLDFFFNWFAKWCGGNLPGAGSYHYTDVDGFRTFDIYNKYDFGPCNLYGDCVTDEQWTHMLDIGYITQAQFDDRCA